MITEVPEFPGLEIRKSSQQGWQQGLLSTFLFCSLVHLREEAGSDDGGLEVAEPSDSWECPHSGPQGTEELEHGIGPVDLTLVYPE